MKRTISLLLALMLLFSLAACGEGGLSLDPSSNTTSSPSGSSANVYIGL